MLFLTAAAVLIQIAVISQTGSAPSAVDKSPLPSIDVIFRTHRIIGVRGCIIGGQPTACVEVENAWPGHFVQVYGNVAENANDVGEGHALKFHEALVISWAFPFPLPPNLFAVPVHPAAPVISYSSEADKIAWRNAALDFTNVPTQLGAWGMLTPSSGFALSPYAESLTAARAIYNATSPDAFTHVRNLVETYFPLPGHIFKGTTLDAAFRIGAPVLAAQDRESSSRTLWHYAYFRACFPCWGPVLQGPRNPLEPF